MGVTIFDLFGEIFSENDMTNFLKENGIDPNGLIGGGLAIRCFLLLKVSDKKNPSIENGQCTVKIPYGTQPLRRTVILPLKIS